jgi:hypothetical protein
MISRENQLCFATEHKCTRFSFLWTILMEPTDPKAVIGQCAILAAKSFEAYFPFATIYSYYSICVSWGMSREMMLQNG